HIEETLRSSISKTPAGSFLTLAPAAGREIVGAVRRLVAEHASRGSGAMVVLTQPDIRRFVRKLIEIELPDLSVVSYAELLPEIAIRPLGRATFVAQPL